MKNLRDALLCIGGSAAIVLAGTTPAPTGIARADRDDQDDEHDEADEAGARAMMRAFVAHTDANLACAPDPSIFGRNYHGIFAGGPGIPETEATFDDRESILALERYLFCPAPEGLGLTGSNDSLEAFGNVLLVRQRIWDPAKPEKAPYHVARLAIFEGDQIATEVVTLRVQEFIDYFAG